MLQNRVKQRETEAEVVNGMSNDGEMDGLPLILFHPALVWVLEMALGADCHWGYVSGSSAVQGIYKTMDVLNV